MDPKLIVSIASAEDNGALEVTPTHTTERELEVTPKSAVDTPKTLPDTTPKSHVMRRPKLKIRNDQRQIDTAKVMKEKLEALILQTQGGAGIIERYAAKKTLGDNDLQDVFGIICDHIQEENPYGQNAARKEQFAIGFVNLFPSFKDKRSLYGCGGIFCRKNCSGMLEWKYKTYRKSVKRSHDFQEDAKSAKRIKIAHVVSPIARRDMNVDEEQLDEDEGARQERLVEIQKHISWLQQNLTADKRPQIIERHKKTFGYRRERLTDMETTAGDLIEEFSTFLAIDGLISEEFSWIFSEQAEALQEHWTEIKEKIVTIATDKCSERKLKGLEAQLALVTEKKESFQDDAEPLIKLLVHLLPPDNTVEKASKVPVDVAISMLLDYQPIGTDVEKLLEDRAPTYTQPRSPYLLIIGTPQHYNAIFIVIDHHPVPTFSSMVRAFDELFKAHYVFGIKYQAQHYKLFTFIQTAVFKIDESDNDPTSVKFMATKFGL